MAATDCDVLIVGAGPTGLTLACGLARGVARGVGLEAAVDPGEEHADGVADGHARPRELDEAHESVLALLAAPIFHFFLELHPFPVFPHFLVVPGFQELPVVQQGNQSRIQSHPKRLHPNLFRLVQVFQLVHLVRLFQDFPGILVVQPTRFHSCNKNQKTRRMTWQQRRKEMEPGGFQKTD